MYMGIITRGQRFLEDMEHEFIVRINKKRSIANSLREIVFSTTFLFGLIRFEISICFTIAGK